MISRLRGLLLEKTPPLLLVDVGGVGYDVFAPMTTIYRLPDVGSEVTLHTHFVVREDVQQLYGFADTRDRRLFRTLIRVNGVGPKMALAIMSGMEVNDLVRCVRSDNVAALTTIPGIGKKTAERLLVELRDKLGEWDFVIPASASTAGGAVSPDDYVAEAESALVALGYKPQDATRMVSAVQADRGNEKIAINSEMLIRLALRAAVKI
jgi:holliday junction DNA helicase RuvA